MTEENPKGRATVESRPFGFPLGSARGFGKTGQALDKERQGWGTRSVASKSMIYKDVSYNSFKLKDLEEIPPKSLILKYRHAGEFQY